MNTRRMLLSSAVILAFACASPSSRAEDASVQPGSALTISQLLSTVPEGATWQNLDPKVRDELGARAAAALAQSRREWGLDGLRTKEKRVREAPTPEITKNVDTVLSGVFATELPDGFSMSRDVRNSDLRRLLVDIYLGEESAQGFLLYNHPDYRAWDGSARLGIPLVDGDLNKALAQWYSEIDTGLRSIPDDSLTSTEAALREKAYFFTRGGKHFRKPPVSVNGSLSYSGFYSFPSAIPPDDDALLEAYAASIVADFGDVNVGTVDAFRVMNGVEFNRTALKGYGMSDDLADKVLKMGNLYRTRVEGLPGHDDRCTIYSPSDRAAIWDEFTAGQRGNADGSETFQSYAKQYGDVAAQRLATIRDVAALVVSRTFPGDADLPSAERSRVLDRLANESRPAKMQDTLLAALVEKPETAAAAARMRQAIAAQPMVGPYTAGDPVREEDRAKILAIWAKIRGFIAQEYRGYRLDIGKLVPTEPILITAGDNASALGGKVTISLGPPRNLISLSSTLMHEMKHAIDQNSHAAVEGAAVEGAAESVERQVFPIFIERALADQPDVLPMARLVTEIDNVRFTATTDATLKIFMRESCGPEEPNSIDYAKQIVRSYGYDDQGVISLRSQRAHRGTQYLLYDYGFAQYTDLMAYLQKGVGSTPKVDAFLLQACKMPSPKKNQAAIDDLKACISDRKQ